MPLKRRCRAALGLALAGLAAGCSLLHDLGSAPAAAASAPPRPASSDWNSIAPLLDLMSALPQGDPARQAELFQSAKDAAAIAPTTSNRLRYALALGVPGHGGSDPVAAQRQLAELLARPETLLPSERLLAMVEEQEVEQRLVLQAENQRLRDEAPRESHDRLNALNRRLAAESDENARLRKALEEARAKLEAVTHIERSINDRSPGGVRTP